ncbi:MAG: hypothetical protein IKT40_01845 [Bacilli bacterium]|nr:hypothetical protein [Bacilli bacterium]
MSDLNNTTVDVVKYLDLAGLNTLWAKISEKFTRKADLIGLLTDKSKGLITNDEEVFVQYGEILALKDKVEGIEAGQAVKVDGDTIVQNDENVISANLILHDNKENHTLSLATKKYDSSTGEFIGTEISSWDYSNLYSEAIKNGMIKNVSLVVVPSDETAEESGQGEGTYLKFEFETSAGDSSPIYVNVSDLIDVYTGSTYIKVEGNAISLETAALVNHISDALEITSITTRLSTAESNIGALQSKVAELEALVDGLDLTAITDSIEDLDYKVSSFEEKLANVPTVAITEDEINNLE